VFICVGRCLIPQLTTSSEALCDTLERHKTEKKPKMKLYLFFSILISQYSFSQEKTVVCVNDTNSYHNKTQNYFSNEPTFCDLTINSDFTFSFYSRPNVSCFTWKEIKGNWKKKKNIYTFSSQYEVKENDTRFTFSQDTTKKYLLKFRTDKKSELKNRNIQINYIYDFASEIKDIQKTMSFNLENSIEIPFIEIPNIDKLAAIRIEYLLSSNEKRFEYITENKMINVKEKDIPNIVEIEFVELPKKEIVYRTTIGKIENEQLEIVSSKLTKSNLPYYLREIKFEKYYKIKTEK
jgi:hypothetical protein